MNNGKRNAQCRSGVWFGQDDPRNKAIRIPRDPQSNQVSEVAAVIAALETVPPYQPAKIITDSKYVIKGLTTHLESWENDRWIGIKNTNVTFLGLCRVHFLLFFHLLTKAFPIT